MKYELNEIVYHKDIYNYKEPLKVVGIRANELELEGDYSGGTSCITQKNWLPIEGVSRTYNHGYKKECNDFASACEFLMYCIEGLSDNDIKSLIYMIYNLTEE